MTKLQISIAFVVIFLNLCNAQRRFPDSFKFGSASASYQVEGAWNRDGKGENIWDHLTHNYPEKVVNRDNGDVACNSYDKYKEDVALLKSAGMDFYRFSLSWSRILPNGDLSVINEKGLQYYDNLINELLANGIEPMITLYHWDLPQPLQELGGWPNSLIIEDFVEYANVVLARYSDRVKTWATFNEPIIVCENGYGGGSFAPNIHSPGVADYMCAHNLLISHARVYHLYQEKYKRDGDKMGIVINCGFSWPSNDNVPADVMAAQRSMQFSCGWYSHPIFSAVGGYPQIMIDTVNQNSLDEGRPWSRLPEMSSELQAYIQGTADFFGLNYYTSEYAYMSESCGGTSFYSDRCVSTYQDAAWPLSASGWLRSVPQGLRAVLNWIKSEYNNPEIIITENGWSDHGELEDLGRINYFKGHFEAILDAIDDEVNITGHTTWSILDNFEWLQGYSERFGVVKVDFNDPERPRTPKSSLVFLKQVIETRVVPN